jgi:hypothetical protein
VSKEPNFDELLIESIHKTCRETSEFDSNSEQRSLYRYFLLAWALGFDDFRFFHKEEIEHVSYTTRKPDFHPCTKILNMPPRGTRITFLESEQGVEFRDRVLFMIPVNPPV